MVFPYSYTKSETFDLLANNVSTTGGAALTRNLDVGPTCTNQIRMHGTGVATSYAVFKN